jgi:uncharacterized protein (DUF1697 family)
LGFNNVQTLISSGNVLFETNSKDTDKLEAKIEAAWPKQLGFNSTTIIRSQQQLKDLVAQNPFKGVEHSRQAYQLVTFFKNPPSPQPNGQFYNDLGVNALCSTIDTTTAKTPDFMIKLEKQFGKQITSRTYKTVQRILQKME